MKYSLLALFIFLPGSFADTFSIGEYTFHQRTLENGLIAIALQSTNELADVYLAVDAGKRQEAPEVSGIAHLTEHAMFAGTDNIPPQEFEKRIRAFGGRANAFTRQDYTLYYDVKIPIPMLDLVLEMEADRLVNLSFEEQAFRFEQERLKKEEAGDDRIAEQLQAQTDALVFPDHPYAAGIRENGFTKAPTLPAATVRAFYEQHYHPRNTAVVIVSREAPAQTLERIERAFKELPAGPERPPSKAIPATMPLEIKETLASGLRSRRVETIWRIPPLGTEGHHASLLLGELIGNRASASNHSVNVIVGNRLDGDSLRIWATGEHAEQKLAALDSTLEQHPFTPQELDQAKADLSDDFEQLKIHSRPYFSLPARIAQYAANKQPNYVPGFAKQIQKISLAQIHDRARQLIGSTASRGTVTFTASGELQALPENPKALAKFAADAQEAGQHAEAIEAYSRLLDGKLNAMFKIIYLASRGQVYLDSRDYDAAIGDFKAAIQLSDYPALPPLLDEAQRLKAASMARSQDVEPSSDAEPTDDTEPTDKDLKQELFDLIPIVSAELEAWRGLKFKTPVKVTFTNNPPEEKLGGWYDSETKELFVSVQDDRPQFSKGVLYHELFHALQDQHYDLLKLHQETKDRDAERALTAIIEGEAMFAVSELMDYNFLAHANIRDKGPIPPKTFEKKFHYGAGLRFIMQVKEKDGWAGVTKVFRHPPRTTREIYYPDQYPAKAVPPMPRPQGSHTNVTTGMYDIRWLFTRPVETRKSAIQLADQVVQSRQAQIEGKTIWQLQFDSEKACRDTADILRLHAAQVDWTVEAIEDRRTLRLNKR